MSQAHPPSSQAAAFSHPGSARPVQLEIRALNCTFGAITVVRDIDLCLSSGEHVAIIGGNGSGKTTLLRTVIGLHTDWSGEIRVDGELMETGPRAAHSAMVWMPQRQPKGQFPFTVRELLFSGQHEKTSCAAADFLDISALLDRPLTALSGGQLQRAYLARTMGSLAAGAGLLLADEPTSALDFQGQEQVADMLTALPASMLVVTHDPALAKKCHRILQMAQGIIREITL